ncbi:YicC family protein [Prevotella sp. PINT]|uniref:YicC/YloC family endoribonuclease n=1 Tax=Palleniella intestinalis TaxID=2736291 RepID=UPI001555380F|nr:YicC/YloC family endoribonuclease [Palleniella intestinalis]NPD81873.1 YicC family protein [Palleniella intestinalis]
MIQSMTGFGKATVTFENKKINVEVKALNSKTLDLSTRIAPLYREKEMEIRQIVSDRLSRGKVDFCIWIDKDETAAATPINPEMVDFYYQQINKIAYEKDISLAMDWSTILRLPDVLSRNEVETLGEEEWTAARNAIDCALAQLIEFRIQEGAALQKKFSEKLDNIASLQKELEPYEQSRVEKIRQRITDNLKLIPDVEYDKNRLEQELIYYIEKLDISEEKQRLTNHLQYFRDTMLLDEPIGKKLGFIAQEMGREINTTGSKSNQAEMQNIVVKMKDELEQIKEQVLNAL